jgi:hypothetical protein
MLSTNVSLKYDKDLKVWDNGDAKYYVYLTEDQYDNIPGSKKSFQEFQKEADILNSTRADEIREETGIAPVTIDEIDGGKTRRSKKRILKRSLSRSKNSIRTQKAGYKNASLSRRK